MGRLAEEFARLYGVGALSQETMLDLMGYSQIRDRTPPLVFESTPRSQPNVIMDQWISAVSGTLVNGDASRIRGVVVPDLIYGDE